MRSNQPTGMRPFVFINVATTADGKLAPANRKFIPFGSKADQDLLYELRSRADALIAGARTVDSVSGHFGPGPAKYRQKRLQQGLKEYNLRVIVSGNGTVNPAAEIFRRRFSTIIILTTERISQRKLRELKGVADDIGIFGRNELDFVAAFHWLRKNWQVKQLLCEGGGELNAALLRLGLVDEIYQTICPLILGGRDAPTMVDGGGISDTKRAIQLRLKSVRQVGQELFLVHHVRRPRGVAWGTLPIPKRRPFQIVHKADGTKNHREDS